MFSIENGVQQLDLNHTRTSNEFDNRAEARMHAGERAALLARITELQEKLNNLEERFSLIQYSKFVSRHFRFLDL